MNRFSLLMWLRCSISEKGGKYRILFIVIFILFFQQLFAQDNVAVELKERAKQSKQEDVDTVYFQLFMHYVRSDFDSAYKYAELARETALETGDSVTWMRSEYALGHIRFYENNFEEAIPKFRASLNIAARQPDTEHSLKRYSASLNMIGRIHYMTGRLDSAVIYHLSSLENRENNEEGPYSLSIALTNLGLVFYQMRQYDRALTYLEEGYNQRLESKDSTDIDGLLTNIGLAYAGLADDSNEQELQFENYRRAEEYFQRALNYCSDSTVYCSSNSIYEAYNGLGIIYSKVEKYDSSLLMHERAIGIARINGNSYNSIKSLVNLSITYQESGNPRKALEYARSALSTIKEGSESSNLIQLTEIHRELSTIHKGLGNIDSALYHLELYDRFNSEVFSTTITTALDKWANQVISDQDETIAQSQAEQEYQKRQNQQILLVSLVIILLTSVFVIILYRSNKLRKKSNDKLIKANKTIEEKNQQLQDVNLILEERVRERTKELKISNEALKLSNLELDNFIYKTSHDIRGPLATLQGICNVAMIDVTDEKAIDYLEKLSATATNLNEILSKLLIINQINNSVISKEPINFKEIIQQVIKENLERNLPKHVEPKFNVQEGIIFRSDEDLLRIIVGNLVNNSFKFHKKSYSVSSFVEINVQKNNIGITIEVIDNGVGIDDNVQSKVFEIFSKATEMSDSAGLGLYLVKLSVEKLNGKIKLTKSKEGYTKFQVYLPNQNDEK